MKKLQLLILYFLASINSFCQDWGGRPDDFDNKPMSWNEATNSLVPGLIMLAIGLMIMNVFKNSSTGRTVGGILAFLGGFLGFGGIVIYAVNGIVTGIIILIIAFYVFNEFILPNISDDSYEN